MGRSGGRSSSSHSSSSHSGGFSGGERSFGGFSGSGGRSGRSRDSGGRSGRSRDSGGRSSRSRGSGGRSSRSAGVDNRFSSSSSSGGSSSFHDGGSSSGGSTGRGCLTPLNAIWLAIVLFALFGLFGTSTCTSMFENAITPSTKQRSALPESASVETAWFEDRDGSWILDRSQMTQGLQAFYEKTGVRPYVLILPNGSTTSKSELSAIAKSTYSSVCNDEGHFVIAFCDNNKGSYRWGYYVGSSAAPIMDSEACRILDDYLNRYYNDYSLSEEQIFSQAFADTGQRIMEVTLSPAIPVTIVVVGIVVVVAVVLVVRKRRLSHEQERRRLEDTLKTPLEPISDPELADLVQKYENNPTTPSAASVSMAAAQAVPEQQDASTDTADTERQTPPSSTT